MKDSKEYSKKVAAFFKKNKSKIVLKQFESEDKVDSLVYAVLFEHLITDEVNVIVSLMRKHFVDWNDLRVSRLEEVLDVLSPIDVPLETKKKVSLQLINSLNSLFKKYDRISFEDIEELGKRQAYQELEILKFFTPFVVNFLMLNFKGSHALPLNSLMAAYAKKAGIVHPDSTETEIGAFFERQIPVDDIYNFYLLLRQMAESPAVAPEETAAKSAKPAPKAAKPKASSTPVKTQKASKPAAKKSAAKKAAPKKTAKKAASKKKTSAKAAKK